MDKVYVAFWDNGYKYDDQRTNLIGVFSDEETAGKEAGRFTEESKREHAYENASYHIVLVPLNVIAKDDPYF